MTLTDEINQLRQQGSPDDVITQLLTRRGYQQAEIAHALSTSAIKEAVTAPEQNDQDLQPSLSASGSIQDPAPYPVPQAQPEAQPLYADQQQYQDPTQYAYNGGGVSGDTITEIAEQVVAEKMNRVENAFNQLSLFKGTSEAQLRSLDERLKRIENIIDKLQLSLLQRVGDYLTNVEDVKRELIETQKTVKSMNTRGQSSQAPSSPRTRQSTQSE